MFVTDEMALALRIAGPGLLINALAIGVGIMRPEFHIQASIVATFFDVLVLVG